MTTAIEHISWLIPLLRDDHLPGLLIGREPHRGEGEPLALSSPIDGHIVARVGRATAADVDKAQAQAQSAFEQWRRVPAPQRGELIRRFGNLVRERKAELASLITLEVGKTVQEAQGEVQEVIDVCDFAVGLSRQLYGLTIASERPEHRLMEQWHPLGPVAVITAFNFPMAVWSWNATIALVCGDTLVWKPSDKTPLCSMGLQQTLNEAAASMGDTCPDGLSTVIIGDAEVGQAMAAHTGFPLVSATGSIPMGRKVGQTVAGRLGRTLLELGGNNAMIVTPTANLDMALNAIVFAAVGTAGQRCTSLRRVIVHRSIRETLLEGLEKAYERLPIGDPRDEKHLVGPLINETALTRMQEAIQTAREQGGTLICGGERVESGNGVPAGGVYVQPAIMTIPAEASILTQETFAPLLYIIDYDTLDEAIAIHNAVPQGLSSAIFTNSLQETERFISAEGSDCGLINVNIGTSGAEIGGAFGGEKQTGGGRESGSDAWKSYMRRATNTINYGSAIPLAQGIKFEF